MHAVELLVVVSLLLKYAPADLYQLGLSLLHRPAESLHVTQHPPSAVRESACALAASVAQRHKVPGGVWPPPNSLSTTQRCLGPDTLGPFDQARWIARQLMLKVLHPANASAVTLLF
jgi:hypothetical protein